MPLSPFWKKPGTRVLTAIGAGAIGGRLRGGSIEVRLDKPWAGENESFHSPGEIVLDTDFTLLRIVNVDGVDIITSAVNYPDWDDVVGAQLAPYSEDETLIGLNFASRKAVCARIWNRLGNYHLIEAGMDRHTHRVPAITERRDQAVMVWERVITPLAGTSGHLLIIVLLAFEDDQTRILARKVLGATMVLKDEHYY
jgi:hypothetical protein